MQPMRASALPFSYIHSDSPGGFPGEIPGASHQPHTGFLKMPEYKQQTVKVTSPTGGEEVLRSIQKELETRLQRVGSTAPLTVEEDERNGGKGLAKEDARRNKRRANKAPEGVGLDRAPVKNPRYEKNYSPSRLMQDIAQYDHPHLRVKVHDLFPPEKTSDEGQGRIFHAGASRSLIQRSSDVDSGCHSDASDSRARQSAFAQRDIVLRPVSLEHPGIFDNFELRTRFSPEDTFTRQNFGQVPVIFEPKHKHSGEVNFASEDYLKPTPHVINQGHSKRRTGDHRNLNPKGGNHDNHHHRNRSRNAGHVTNKPLASASNPRPERSGKHPEPQIPKTQVFFPAPRFNPSATAIFDSASGFGGSQDSLVTNLATSTGQSNGSCCSCHKRTVLVLVLLFLMFLAGFGAGFVAGWFGRQAAHS